MHSDAVQPVNWKLSCALRNAGLGRTHTPAGLGNDAIRSPARASDSGEVLRELAGAGVRVAGAEQRAVRGVVGSLADHADVVSSVRRGGVADIGIRGGVGGRAIGVGVFVVVLTFLGLHV